MSALTIRMKRYPWCGIYLHQLLVIHFKKHLLNTHHIQAFYWGPGHSDTLLLCRIEWDCQKNEPLIKYNALGMQKRSTYPEWAESWGISRNESGIEAGARSRGRYKYVCDKAICHHQTDKKNSEYCGILLRPHTVWRPTSLFLQGLVPPSALWSPLTWGTQDGGKKKRQVRKRTDKWNRGLKEFAPSQMQTKK